jgi:hypothetical protein
MRAPLTRAVSGVAIATAAVLALAVPASAKTVPPAKVHTTLSIVEAKSTIVRGQKDLVSGTLKAGKKAAAKEVVFLDRVAGRKLIPVRAELTSKVGRVSFVVEPKVTTRYELVFRGTKRLAASHSGVVTTVVKVKKK